MEDEFISKNAAFIEKELKWLDERITSQLGNAGFEVPSHITPSAIDLEGADKPNYVQILESNGLSKIGTRLILALALAPHLRPELLDKFFEYNEPYKRGYTQFGGVRGKNHSGFVPTLETAVFLLAGDDLAKRIEALEHFQPNAPLFRLGILEDNDPPMHEPDLSRVLSLSHEWLYTITTGKEYFPPFSSTFPAEKLEATLGWDDLVLDPSTQNEVREIEYWLRHHNDLTKVGAIGRHLAPGYRSLFYGPPGTGKSLTAALLGKQYGRPVFRIDISKVVSKYVGETEKNLSRLFNRAEDRRWILFFDEADSLFGKRTENRDSNDRFANQEISYLLQRIETYRGVVILATNLKKNIDEAFSRRFQSTIHFPAPNAFQRKKLWMNILDHPDRFQFDHEIDYDKLAAKYELTGGGIINVFRRFIIHASADEINRGKDLEQEPLVITHEHIVSAITREMKKEGKGLDPELSSHLRNG